MYGGCPYLICKAAESTIRTGEEDQLTSVRAINKSTKQKIIVFNIENRRERELGKGLLLLISLYEIWSKVMITGIQTTEKKIAYVRDGGKR